MTTHFMKRTLNAGRRASLLLSSTKLASNARMVNDCTCKSCSFLAHSSSAKVSKSLRTYFYSRLQMSSLPDLEFIKMERTGNDGRVAVLTLNRPKALNALCRSAQISKHKKIKGKAKYREQRRWRYVNACTIRPNLGGAIRDDIS